MIYFITAICANKYPEYQWAKRTFGFFSTRNDYHNAIKHNTGNMHEGFYDLLVVEKIIEGIHPPVLVEWWYRWNGKKWESTDRPSKFYGITNWALG